VSLASATAVRLRMKKYEYLKQNPVADKHHIPWDELLKEEKERVGKRTFKGMISHGRIRMREKAKREPGMKPPARDKSRSDKSRGTNQIKTSRQGQESEKPRSETFAQRKARALSSVVYVRFDSAKAHEQLPKEIDPSLPYPVQLKAPMVKLNPETDYHRELACRDAACTCMGARGMQMQQHIEDHQSLAA